MKRFYILLLALCAVCMAQAQVGVVRSSGVYSVQKATPQDLGPLTRDGNIYYYHDQPMTEQEMVAFIQKDCIRAYNHYKKWKKVEIAGWSLMGVGVGFVGIASGCLAISNDEIRPGLVVSFYVMGVAAGASGIILGSVAHVKKKNAHKQYNTWCGYKELEQSQAKATPLEFKLTSGVNGLGLALGF